MKQLIVNADDFAWSAAVTSGILRSHRDGVVTSTTLMTNLPGAEEALDRARREAPRLAIGLHLNLTEGRPLAPPGEVAPLLGRAGDFHRSLLSLSCRAPLSQAVRWAVEREVEAQLAWAWGHNLRPSHLDSHKHVHLHPALLPIVITAARRNHIQAVRTTAEVRLPHLSRFLPEEWGTGHRMCQWVLGRVARRWGHQAQRAVRDAGLVTTDWFFGVEATGAISAPLLQHLLGFAPEGTGEVMVHPGLAADGREPPTRLRVSRARDLEALCDPKVRLAAEAHNWTWATYEDLGDG